MVVPLRPHMLATDTFNAVCAWSAALPLHAQLCRDVPGCGVACESLWQQAPCQPSTAWTLQPGFVRPLLSIPFWRVRHLFALVVAAHPFCCWPCGALCAVWRLLGRTSKHTLGLTAVHTPAAQAGVAACIGSDAMQCAVCGDVRIGCLYKQGGGCRSAGRGKVL